MGYALVYPQLIGNRGFKVQVKISALLFNRRYLT
jgi:hypothetical protein